MMDAADALDFERAAALRDRISQMRESMGEAVDEVEVVSATRSQRGRGRRKGKKGSRVPKPKRA